MGGRLRSGVRTYLHLHNRIFDTKSGSHIRSCNRTKRSQRLALRSILETAFEVAFSCLGSVEFDARSNDVPFYRSYSGTLVVGGSFINLLAHIYSPIFTRARKRQVMGTLSPASLYIAGSVLADVWNKPASLVLYTSAPGILLRRLHGMSRPTG